MEPADLRDLADPAWDGDGGHRPAPGARDRDAAQPGRRPLRQPVGAEAAGAGSLPLTLAAGVYHDAGGGPTLLPGPVWTGLEPNLAVYGPGTAHGSSLPPAAHAALLAQAGDPSGGSQRVAVRPDP